MRKLLMVAAMALVPVVSQAQLSLGLRVGFAPAIGDAFKDPDSGEGAKLSDGVRSQIPIQVDALYAVTPDVKVGAYLSYGFGQINDDGFLDGVCTASGVDCSARAVRLGVQAIYAFNKIAPEYVPWVGVGLGYEWASAKAEAGGQEATFKLSGFELLNLQLGTDYRVSPKLSVGPYIAYSLGQYGDPTVEQGGVSVDVPADSAIHSWFGFGLRGQFDL